MSFDYKEVLKIGALGALGLLFLAQVKSMVQSIEEAHRIMNMKVSTIDQVQQELKDNKSQVVKLVKLKPYYFQPQQISISVRSAEKLKFEPSDKLIIQRMSKALSFKVNDKTKAEEIPYPWFAASQIKTNEGKNYVKINGFGKIAGDFFSVERNYQQLKTLTVFQKIRKWINTFFITATKQTCIVGAGNTIKPFFLGPVVGFLHYQVNLMKNTRIVAACKFQNGQIIPTVTAASKSEIINYFKERVHHKSLKVGILLLSIIIVGRWLWSDIKRYLNVLKVRRDKIRNSYFNPKDIAQDKMCIICYSNCRNMIFFDCRHMIMCRQCSQNYDSQKCPYCKNQIDDIKIVSGV